VLQRARCLNGQEPQRAQRSGAATESAEQINRRDAKTAERKDGDEREIRNKSKWMEGNQEVEKRSRGWVSAVGVLWEFFGPGEALSGRVRFEWAEFPGRCPGWRVAAPLALSEGVPLCPAELISAIQRSG
jgi:hypothetical protein